MNEQPPPSYYSIFPENQRNEELPRPAPPPPLLRLPSPVREQSNSVASLFQFKYKRYQQNACFGLFCPYLAAWRLSYRFQMQCTRLAFFLPIAMVAGAIWAYFDGFADAAKLEQNPNFLTRNNFTSPESLRKGAEGNLVNLFFWAVLVYLVLILLVRRKFITVSSQSESVPKSCCIMTFCYPCAHGQMGSFNLP